MVGVRDEVYGEVPVACPGVTLDLDELTALCREQLTKIKVPATIHVLDALPKNPLGKVDKPALRHRSAAGAVSTLGV